MVANHHFFTRADAWQRFVTGCYLYMYIGLGCVKLCAGCCCNQVAGAPGNASAVSSLTPPPPRCQSFRSPAAPCDPKALKTPKPVTLLSAPSQGGGRGFFSNARMFTQPQSKGHKLSPAQCSGDPRRLPAKLYEGMNPEP